MLTMMLPPFSKSLANHHVAVITSFHTINKNKLVLQLACLLISTTQL